MPVRQTQNLSANTLYKLEESYNPGMQRAAIECVGGPVTIYGSLATAAPASPPANMSVARSNFQGIDDLGFMPEFIYFTGSPARFTLTGVKATQVT